MENPSSFGLGTGISSQKSRRSSGLTCCFIKNLGKSRSDLPAGLLSSAENIPSHPTMSLLTYKKNINADLLRCVSIYPSIHQSHLPIYQSIHPSTHPIYRSIYRSNRIYRSIYRRIYLSMLLFTYLSIFLLFYLSKFLYVLSYLSDL